jgi:hypothetical protein
MRIGFALASRNIQQISRVMIPRRRSRAYTRIRTVVPICGLYNGEAWLVRIARFLAWVGVGRWVVEGTAVGAYKDGGATDGDRFSSCRFASPLVVYRRF